MKNRLSKKPKGNAANYITRGKALKRLQLSLPEFRRICILKGIYPRDPKKKSEGTLKTYYLAKDIQFLSHEPLLNTFRDIRAHRKKIARAKAKNELGLVKQLNKTMPTYNLDHIVRERYPSFRDALKDLDDALNMVHLFACLPAVGKITAKRVQNCANLAKQFQYYVACSHSLKKVFVSIKGIYYQADILGEKVTWLDPHKFSQKPPGDVDYKIMLTFLEFYECLLKFVNIKLYLSMGMAYPPPTSVFETAKGTAVQLLSLSAAPIGTGLASQVQDDKQHKAKPAGIVSSEKIAAALSAVTKHVQEEEKDENEDEDAAQGSKKQNGGNNADHDAVAADVAATTGGIDEDGDDPDDFSNQKMLFFGCKFFLGRETPIQVLDFVIKSLGGDVVTDEEKSRNMPGLTYWVIDRPKVLGQARFDVDYIQPQWVFDSVNAGVRLPVSFYSPGAMLPPHLSPFVSDEEGYKPAFQEYIERIKQGDPTIVAENAYYQAQNMHHGEDGERKAGEERDDEDENEDENGSDIEHEEDEDEAIEKNERDASDVEHSESVSAVEEREADSEEEKAHSKKRKMQDAAHAPQKSSKVAKVDEEKELAKMMMSRKHRKLYDTIQKGKEKRSLAVQRVMEKRRELSSSTKKASSARNQ